MCAIATPSTFRCVRSFHEMPWLTYLKATDYNLRALTHITSFSRCAAKSVFLPTLFQFRKDFKLFTYHLLYTGTSLLADVGGYLGLFLGLSCFGLFELFEKALNARKKYERRKSSMISEIQGGDGLQLEKRFVK